MKAALLFCQNWERLNVGINHSLTKALTEHNQAEKRNPYNGGMKKMLKRKSNKPVDARTAGERIFEGGFFLCASVSILAVALIMIFIFIKGAVANRGV